MSIEKIAVLALAIWGLASCQSSQAAKATTLTIATFNVSMEATNYQRAEDEILGPQMLMRRLKRGDNPQIKNIAEIIQRARPDIILLNEFDYIEDKKQGVEAFINNYLAKAQNGAAPIYYPYVTLGPVNTGMSTPFDLDHNGKKEGFKADAQGFGFFHGHYGMVLLSKYPIQRSALRTFQTFLWSDMPGALRPTDPDTNQPWYNDEQWPQLRLSSKSHWDVPVEINGKILHVLASHPTPPVFDGPEDRNGKRNHDEIRFWTDYLEPAHSGYIYDDKGTKGGLASNASFVIVGDQNASPVEGDATRDGIGGLLASSRINVKVIPQSLGGQQNKPTNPNAINHTAIWGARADYVLPSNDIEIVESGIFWPIASDPLFRLVADRKASSDHRLVWVKVVL